MHVRTDLETWLLQGDPSVCFFYHRDLIGAPDDLCSSFQKRIPAEGWGKRLLARQDTDGLWGGGLYSPKWISTTYTLLLLRRLGIPRSNRRAGRAAAILLDRGLYGDGGINFSASMKHSETCITGLVLSLVSYFLPGDGRAENLVAFLLEQQMADGGWNCRSFKGDSHSSFHTTINVLEGLGERNKLHPGGDLKDAQKAAVEFLLVHRLFQSHRTGKTVDRRMTMLSFPPRWRYDILRFFDYCSDAAVPYDSRMDDAVSIIVNKRRRDGTWPVQCRHPGRTYFELEATGRPSRINTVRALRMLKWLEEQEVP